MNFTAGLVTIGIRLLLRILCRVEGEKLASVPRRGPLILVTNHISFLEIPLMYTLLSPRNICGLVKKETGNHWLLKMLGEAWGAILINREKPDPSTFRKVEKALQENKILCIAPEGTRSRTGVMGKGQRGVVLIALKNHVPILPVAHYGAEKFWQNLWKMKKTRVTFVVGKPFLLESRERMDKDIYQEMTDQVMTRLASLLPPYYRGVYQNLDILSDEFIRSMDMKALTEKHSGSEDFIQNQNK